LIGELFGNFARLCPEQRGHLVRALFRRNGDRGGDQPIRRRVRSAALAFGRDEQRTETHCLAGHIGFEPAKSVRYVSDWICVTTCPEVGATWAAETLLLP